MDWEECSSAEDSADGRVQNTVPDEPDDPDDTFFSLDRNTQSSLFLSDPLGLPDLPDLPVLPDLSALTAQVLSTESSASSTYPASSRSNGAATVSTGEVSRASTAQLQFPSLTGEFRSALEAVRRSSICRRLPASSRKRVRDTSYLNENDQIDPQSDVQRCTSDPHATDGTPSSAAALEQTVHSLAQIEKRPKRE